MTSSEIKVTFGALAAAEGDVKATATRIHTQLEDLKRFLAPMVSTWTGQAAEGYQATQRKWDTSAADLTQVLNQIGVMVGQANGQYQDTERKNASFFGG